MTEQTPNPSRPKVDTSAVIHYVQNNDVSWNQALEVFEQQGLDVSELRTVVKYMDGADLRRQYADERVETIMAERSEPYDPQNRPPLPTAGFFGADPLADQDVADSLKNFGTVELQQVESTTPPMEPGEPEVHEVPDSFTPGRVVRRKAVAAAIPLEQPLAEAFIRTVEGITEFKGRVLAGPFAVVLELPVAFADEPVRHILSEGQWLVIESPREVSVWNATDLEENFDEIPEGMTHALVPETALVIAVPDDLTVKDLFKNLTNPGD